MSHAVNYPYEKTPSYLSLSRLEKTIQLTPDEKEAISKINQIFPLKLSRHYASLIDGSDPNDPLRKIIIPSLLELERYKDDDELDVHHDESCYQPVEGIIHRYPGKLLLLPTLECLGHCRFCFRSGRFCSTALSEEALTKAINYILKNKEIRDVIVTGGDPMVLSKGRLNSLLERIRSINHVEIIRITSRALIYTPEIMDDEMVEMLSQFKPLFFIHSFVHPREITPLCIEKLNRMSRAGITMLQQGPVLRGVNDSAPILKMLYEKLVQNGVLPYYLIYGIMSKGTRHFVKNRTEVKKLIAELENNTSGFCIPHMSTLDPSRNKTRSMN